MIAKAARQLPPQMPVPPSYQKVNPGDQPVMLLVLRSSILPISTVDEYGESTIAQRISTVTGVAQVQVCGAAKYAVRIDLDPRNLSAYGIGIDEAANAIQNANVNLPTGTIYGPEHTYTILANGQLLHAPAYASTIVAYRNGNPYGSTRSRTSTTASRTTSRRAGIRVSAPSISPSRSSRAPTSSRSSTRSSSCCRPSARSCRRR